MIKSTHTSRSLLLLAVCLNFQAVFGQITIKGSLWENGNEAACNWYFMDQLACMELISLEDDGTSIQTRIVMNAQTNQMTITTRTSVGVNCLTVSADSIQVTGGVSMRFVPTKEEKYFEGFGTCKKVQAKSHEQESLLFYFENEKIDLSKFAAFIKNDSNFEWLSQHTSHGFPAQALTVDALGNLKRSYLASTLVETINEYVFELECK
jgi:hypothetical protein